MESERNEIYERIPWETLEGPQGDKRWLAYAIAGAIAIGALVFSFVRSQPLPAPVATSPSMVSVSPVATAPAPATPVQTSPMVIAEADLYAVDVESYMRAAAGYAELAAIEYFETGEGSAEPGLMPSGTPAAVVPRGMTVEVDWVGVGSIEAIDHFDYEVEVLVRSRTRSANGELVRQPTRSAVFRISIGPDGTPHVAAPPVVTSLHIASTETLTLVDVPDAIRAQVEATHGPVVGGEPLANGRWLVVAMALGTDGVSRPVTVFP